MPKTIRMMFREMLSLIAVPISGRDYR